MANLLCLGGDVLGVEKPNLRDISLILRNGLEFHLTSFLISTSNDSLVMTLARKMITELEYSVFDTHEINIQKERKLQQIFDVLLPIHTNLDEAKKFLSLITFHFEHNKFFSLYDTFSYQEDSCPDCDVHITSVYVLDDIYDGYIQVKKQWTCSDGWTYVRNFVDMEFKNLCKVLKGEASYNLENRKLMLSGDVETNPGPETRIQELERQIKEMQERLRRLDNKDWRDRDRRKTSKKLARRTAQGLRSFCSNTGEAMNVMANGMGPVMESIKHAMESISKIGEDVKATFKIPSEIDIVGSLLSVAQLVNSILSKNVFACSLICAQLARQCGVSLGSLLSIVPSFTSGNVEFKSEDNSSQRIKQSLLEGVTNLEDKYPIIAIGTVLTGIVTLFCKGSVPPIKDIMTHFGVIGRAAQGFRAVRDFFGWLWDYIMSIYCQTMYGISYEEYKITKEFPEIAQICGGIRVAETVSRELISNSAEICEQIISMKAKLEDYILDAVKIRSKNLNFVTKLRDRLKEKYECAITSPAIANAIRDEPVCVYLYGQPGVGKSVMTTVLTADYYKEYLKERGVNYNSVSHSRKAINEHWDGYSNQPIVVVDDFGNKKDNVMNPCTEFEELQYMVNTSAYSLWMADLAKKGVTFFNSELILLSSNLKYPSIVHMVDPSSIFRRMHIWAEVVCKAEYGTYTGKDSDGNMYYQYDKKTAAKTKGVAEKDLPPLMTEQYLIKLYKISMDKQTGSVIYHDMNKILTYEEFYQYFKTVKEERSTENRNLSNALRERAGLPGLEDKVTEQKILDMFKEVFNPPRLIDSCAEELGKCPKSRCNCKKDNSKTKETNTSCDEVDGANISIPKCVCNFVCTCVKVECSCDDKENCRCLFDPHIPSMTPDERAKFDIQFGDISELDFCDADDMDVDLIDVATPSASAGAWKIKLEGLFSVAVQKFTKAIKYIYSKVSSGIRHTFNKMIGVGGVIVSYLGAAFGKFSEFLSVPCVVQPAILTVLGLATGYLGSAFFHGVPSSCEFSLTLNEVYSPCKVCDVCSVMDYSEDGGYLDHFLRRVGVPQVRAALMRCHIWSDTYLSKIFQRTEEKLRIAERVYSSQPAIPKPTYYAQALFGNCAIPDAVNRVRATGMGFTEANILLGSVCRYNCNFCCNHKFPYNPMDNNDVIRVGQEIYDKYMEYITTPPLSLPLIQGSKRCTESDIVRVEQCTNILAKNSAWVQAVTEDGIASRSTGTFVVGRTFITTAHTVFTKDFKFSKIAIQNPNSKETLDIPIKDCKISRIKQKDDTPTDLVLITLPPVVPSRPKIINKFIRAKDLDLLQEGDVILSGFRELQGRLVLNEQQTKRFCVSTRATEYYEHPPGTCPHGEPCGCQIRIGNHIDYEIDTYPGCSGSLISARNKNIPSKIIGFHVAGVKGQPALGVILTSELLQSALQDHIQEFSLPDTYMIDGKFPYSDS